MQEGSFSGLIRKGLTDLVLDVRLGLVLHPPIVFLLRPPHLLHLEEVLLFLSSSSSLHLASRRSWDSTERLLSRNRAWDNEEVKVRNIDA